MTTEMFALWKGAVIVKVLAMTTKNKKRMAVIRFDNGEDAEVPCIDLKMMFDLENE